MKTLFVPCSFDGLPLSAGSIQIRAEWPAKYWDGADVYDRSQRLTGYDLYVFQKLYLTAFARKLLRHLATQRNRGECKIAFDLCDPDFLEPEHEQRMSYALPLFDFAIATTQPIADYLNWWLPTYVIPDRVDLSIREKVGRKLTFRRGDKPSLVWAGYANHTSALDELRPAIQTMRLHLETIAVEAPIPFDQFWQQVLQYDILVNPRPNVPPYTYKSDNKTLIAWALGMPVARTPEEIAKLCNEKQRWLESAIRYQDVENKHDVRLSVQQWQDIATKEGV